VTEAFAQGVAMNIWSELWRVYGGPCVEDELTVLHLALGRQVTRDQKSPQTVKSTTPGVHIRIRTWNEDL
jgi:hypothetical protein